jgi:hypothetical protein
MDRPAHYIHQADYGDPTQPANQDRLTANVWLTRENSRGLFNAAKEKGHDGSKHR